jgi:hypothetical protein
MGELEIKNMSENLKGYFVNESGDCPHSLRNKIKRVCRLYASLEQQRQRLFCRSSGVRRSKGGV